MDKKSLGYLEGWLSIVINTALFAFKFWVGTVAGSVAMIADSWHTLSDTFTSVIVIFGFWASAQPADGKHPFGHGRAEPIAAIVIGTLLGVVGVEFFRQSVMRLMHHREAIFGAFAIIVFLISVILKEALARFSIWAGRKTDSSSLIADGWHHRSDAIASALIVVGGAIGGYLWWMDGMLGIGVSVLILYAAYDIIIASTSASLGEMHSSDLEERIRTIAKSAAPTAMDIHHVHVHRYGDHLELTFHMCFPPSMKIEEAHQTAARAKYALKDKLGAESTVHIEPIKTE